MSRFFVIWVSSTALACGVLYALCVGPSRSAPDAASAAWVDAAWVATRSDQPIPSAPRSAREYVAHGPTFVSLYVAGQRRARHIGEGSFADVVVAGLGDFAADPALRAVPGFTLPSEHREQVQLRVAVTTVDRPLLELLPWLSTFSVVPLRDGVAARHGERTAYVTPDDLVEHQLTDNAVVAPIPDLTFGTSLHAVRRLLGVELGLEGSLDDSQPLRRLRIEPVAAPSRASKLDQASLEQAARDGMDFVLRHQHASGRFTYIYDARTNAEMQDVRYSLARHAGASFFLARAALQLGSQPARAGALRALDYVEKNALTSCGSPERLCVQQDDRIEFGGSALTALACAELLRSGDNAQVRRMLSGLLAFLRSQQRPDGEMMHEYSREMQRPVDVQRMYYSGEAALALLTAYEQLHDGRDLDAAVRLMGHLTGSGWRFFGSRYYYGEEHWTCQAVAKAAAHMKVQPALDFCLRWGRWQEHLQYRAGTTPWDVEGAFGVGPVLLPRVTTAASRVEALAPVYQVLAPARRDLRTTRVLIERSLGLLLRSRWAPGPAHLFARPSAAFGGMPSTAADLRSRVDMVQHAGSAFLVWADALGHSAR